MKSQKTASIHRSTSELDAPAESQGADTVTLTLVPCSQVGSGFKAKVFELSQQETVNQTSTGHNDSKL